MYLTIAVNCKSTVDSMAQHLHVRIMDNEGIAGNVGTTGTLLVYYLLFGTSEMPVWNPIESTILNRDFSILGANIPRKMHCKSPAELEQQDKHSVQHTAHSVENTTTVCLKELHQVNLHTLTQ